MRITSTLAALSLGAIAVALPSAAATAQAYSMVPGLTVSFTTPNATIGSHDPIDVFLHMALDAGAAPFTFDGTSPSTNFGLPFALPTQGKDDADQSVTENFASYDAAVTTISAECGATLDGCNSPGTAYTFAFFLSSPSWYGSQHFTLNPGDTYDFLFGTFTPNGGTAPAGVYTFFNAGLDVDIDGTAEGTGNAIFADVNIAGTCSNDLPDCEFSRTVVADTPVTGTPEPATLGLLGMGLGFVGMIRRRTLHNRGQA